VLQCSVLQRVAADKYILGEACCSVLYCVAVQCVAACCSVLQCSVLQRVAVDKYILGEACCSVLYCVAVQCVAACCSR